jgi:prepilin-type N-terminal cleavage/methylation domain-containing protein
MRHTNQLGFSLLESLIALALMSGLCVSLMKLQMHLLCHIRCIRYQQLGAIAQRSLAEKLRSCLGNTACQQLEIERWGNALPSVLTGVESHSVQQTDAFITTLHWSDTKDSITLQFRYE